MWNRADIGWAREPLAEAVPVAVAGPVAETGLLVEPATEPLVGEPWLHLEAGLGLAGPVAEPGLPLEAGLGLARERAPDLAGLVLLRDWAQRTVLVMDWADLSSADEARLEQVKQVDLASAEAAGQGPT